jgi:hypothetical protein
MSDRLLRAPVWKNYLAVGGNTFADIRFLVPSATDASVYDFRNADSFVKYDGSAINALPYANAITTLSDLALDRADNMLYVTFNDSSGSGYHLRVTGFVPQDVNVSPRALALDIDFVMWSVTSSMVGVSVDSVNAYAHSPLSTTYTSLANDGSGIVAAPILSSTIDAASFGSSTLRLATDGRIYVTANDTGAVVSTVEVGADFTGIGSALLIGGNNYAGLISGSGGVYLLNLDTGQMSHELFKVGSRASPTGLETYLATGGNTLADVRYLVPSATDASVYDFKSATSYIKYSGAEINALPYAGPDTTLSDLAVDPATNTLYVTFNDSQNRGYSVRAVGFAPQAAHNLNSAVARGENAWEFSFDAEWGTTYRVQESTDLQNWTTTATIEGSGQRHTHRSESNSPQIFFRLEY